MPTALARMASSCNAHHKSVPFETLNLLAVYGIWKANWLYISTYFCLPYDLFTGPLRFSPRTLRHTFSCAHSHLPYRPQPVFAVAFYSRAYGTRSRAGRSYQHHGDCFAPFEPNMTGTPLQRNTVDPASITDGLCPLQTHACAFDAHIPAGDYVLSG